MGSLYESPKNKNRMGSLYESFQKKSFLPSIPLKESLPISHTSLDSHTLRKRLSSLSVKIQPMASPATSWAFSRSKSMSSMGEYAGSSIRSFWDWSWGWVLSRKPTFARDLELNEEESAMLGCHSKGSWRHVFYKVKAEIKRLVGSHHVGANQGFNYDSYSYAKNFDDGSKRCQS